MANTKGMTLEERRKAKKVARKKHKELYNAMSKQDRNRFLTQIRDKKAKSKEGVVAFTNKIAEAKKQEEAAAKEAEKAPVEQAAPEA